MNIMNVANGLETKAFLKKQIIRQDFKNVINILNTAGNLVNKNILRRNKELKYIKLKLINFVYL